MEAIAKVAAFIAKSKVFYLATNGEGRPDVRPMGAAIPYEGKMYFIAATPMNLHKQLQKDGKIAISAYNGDKWLRLYGTAVLDDSAETAKAFVAMDEKIAAMFPEEIIAPYYIENATASICSFSEEAVTCTF
jgi:uncharacterized pyridoxamine 5'-phosphate oxidase family protein